MDRTSILPLLLVLVSLSTIPTTKSSFSTTPVILSTSLGDIIGVRKLAGAGLSRVVEVFYGIPYAKPPLGSRRFRPPSPAKPWGSAPLDGTTKPKACWQEIDTKFNRFPGVEMWNPNTERDEDCLYLNVWRPRSAPNCFSENKEGYGCEKGSHKSIMVWIYGGGFHTGSAVLDLYEASQLAVRENVIVVNIAYRTGPMGFLYFGNSDVPGNVGLLDQVMALQWIKDNAINLGGSPDDITIFGESAGAASVGFHLFSPMSRDLFNNAIMQSTTPLAEWAVMDLVKAKARSLEFSQKLSCLNHTDMEDVQSIREDVILTCLQAVDPALISREQWNITGIKYFDVSFGPVVDGHFLAAHPAQLLLAGNVKLTNVIAGVTKDEGVYFVLYGFEGLIHLNGEGKLTESEFQEIMLAIADNDLNFRDRLINSYTENEGNNRMDIIDAASGDALFKCSVVNFASEYTKLGGQVYTYSFEENLSSNPWPDWMGVPHGYEIEAVFGSSMAPGSNNTQAEKDLTLQVMNMWANFAKTGSPSGHDDDTKWPLYTTGNQEYVIIDTNGLRTEEGMRQSMCQLWAS